MATKTTSRITMTLGHDGRNWTLKNEELAVSADSLDELDRKLEQALHHRWQHEQPLEVHMMSNNDEMIPEWMKPYMDHYFNRVLELPLRY
ncbi:hypothetical protein CSB45_15185 [candidate division KSB3 bacterium]|uniref:DUF1902 domain-containing protein n=1 Tax=candidate division KSB3 bacterium TaxID=2044937 RepID=A0A2G6E1G3_9BACT|nr:MAG: hypothetical protein CSB45_15185 [candidate division KSB3 bacterium]